MQSPTKHSYAFLLPSAYHNHRTQPPTSASPPMEHFAPPCFSSETGEAPDEAPRPRSGSPAGGSGSARAAAGTMDGGGAGTAVEDVAPAGKLAVGVVAAAAGGEEGARLTWVPLPLRMKRRHALQRTGTGDTALARISRAAPRLPDRRGARVAGASRRGRYISFPDVDEESEVSESDDGDDDYVGKVEGYCDT
ncbi:hypothetical protein NpPPO83_00006097 [Neofusicoccum parvum]|uniref:Uncharacterized protein n=1 Tax=Neofusicoccum parvum TaxID=310453 RepID=A0ACB5RU46_9PEZI|nr:hypothetical protein NpPPO83_00006097 [Neofusicoccum parvum]